MDRENYVYKLIQLIDLLMKIPKIDEERFILNNLIDSISKKNYSNFIEAYHLFVSNEKIGIKLLKKVFTLRDIKDKLFKWKEMGYPTLGEWFN